MRRIVAAAFLSATLAVSAPAQICNSMTGSLNCGGPSGFLPGVGEGLYGSSGRASGNLPGVSTLGGDLTGGDRPGTLGAITFGGDGKRCSGMFRSVNC
jgi:hypothetical protein